MAERNTPIRPLSPHLQIFRPMLTMVMSILHRITGLALYFGLMLLVWWLVAAAVSERQFEIAQAFFGHWFGMLVLFIYSWVLLHHMLGGIRYLIWDTGQGFDLKTVEFLTRANIIGSVALALLVWVIGLGAWS